MSLATAIRRPAWVKALSAKPALMVADARGVAALEFAIVTPFLIVAIMNTVDVARYYYLKMEVQNAAQIGSQAAWTTCDTAHLPATTNCPNLNAAVTAAMQSTSLNTSVTLASGSPSEGYYCVNSTGALVYVSAVSSKPANCSSVGNAAGQPGDYIRVQVSYSYAPLIPSLSVGGLLPTPVTSSAMMRLQ